MLALSHQISSPEGYSTSHCSPTTRHACAQLLASDTAAHNSKNDRMMLCTCACACTSSSQARAHTAAHTSLACFDEDSSTTQKLHCSCCMQQAQGCKACSVRLARLCVPQHMQHLLADALHHPRSLAGALLRQRQHSLLKQRSRFTRHALAQLHARRGRRQRLPAAAAASC